MIFAGPRLKGWRFKQGTWKYRFTGACAAPPYGVSRGLALPNFSVYAEICLQPQGGWGKEYLLGSGVAFGCPESLA